MSDHLEKSEQPARVTRGRLIIAGIVLVTLAVAGISLSSNLKTMYARWDDASGKDAHLQRPSQQLERLDIVSGERRHGFMVEVMRTDGDRARGLMYRRYLPADNGMLFDFGKDQIITMWMKNTFISLDMIFLSADGRIHRIEQRTEPESEKTISSGVPVRAVLEVNAGVAIRLNLKPGDYIVHPMFK
jgi:uncharacterized protein